MPWFRRKRKQEQAPAEAAAPEAPPEEEPAAQAAEEPEKKPARRRGTRGGRARKKKTDTAAKPEEAAEAKAEEEPKPKPRRRRTERKPAQAGRARRALPQVKKEIVVSVEVGEQTVAVLEDGKPAEVYLGRPGHRSIAGNIYKGVVDNVLPGMEASFVDIGLEKNGFLYVDEIVVPELEGRRQGRKIHELISRGEEVLVQAVKDPMGTKGARLTTEISLPGRFLVYTPFGEGIGVSRRLEDAERDRLKAICKTLEVPEGGIIVRTAAEGASEVELTGDLKLLVKLWATIKGRAGRTGAPALVYQEAELPLRIVRDLFIRDFERVLVDHERTYRKIVGYLKRTSPELAARVEKYGGKQPLLEKAGVRGAVLSTLDRRVDLPSGGYLIFDYAEAFTVIDVNTGRFVGGRGKQSSARLEDTITKNNLEAVTEVVRQLRLRDIGGIIVIDFIDMANPKNRQLVEDALNGELQRDRTKTYVVEISPLGLVEMTRQNVTDGPREILTVRCATCDGNGVVVSTETHAVEIERRLRAHVAGSKSEGFLVELNSNVAGMLIGPGGVRLDELEKETGRRFAFKTKKSFRQDHFKVLAEGKAAEIDPQAFPVAPGEELDVTLVDVHLHDDEDAIARRDGYVITVTGAAARVGETVRVRVEQAGRTSATAVLADGTPPGTAVDGAAPEEEGGEAAAQEEEKPKRKTRRGSRGGRGRKKKPATAPAPEAEATTEEPEEPAAGGGDEAAAAEEKPKKKTRRGSRGGRGRRKKPLESSPEAGQEPAPSTS
ncbi:MAG TPA: Rne/Rng family ribonuclease [Gaiellaceae bacterium]|nr:Rne/Rng family ribonuclease [Gaiellaceae bacterium]